MKLALLAPISAFAVGAALFTAAGPAAADGHDAAAPTLAEVLAHERRDDDRARDQYRNPTETLAFFQIEPTMTVAEYGPGGGWYTRVLAPYLMPAGGYIAFNQDSDGRQYRDRAQEARSKAWTERFKSGLAEGMGVDADAVSAFETDEMPEDVAGTVDRVVIFRSMHGLANGNSADDVLEMAWSGSFSTALQPMPASTITVRLRAISSESKSLRSSLPMALNSSPKAKSTPTRKTPRIGMVASGRCRRCCVMVKRTAKNILRSAKAIG